MDDNRTAVADPKDRAAFTLVSCEKLSSHTYEIVTKAYRDGSVTRQRVLCLPSSVSSPCSKDELHDPQ